MSVLCSLCTWNEPADNMLKTRFGNNQFSNKINTVLHRREILIFPAVSWFSLIDIVVFSFSWEESFQVASRSTRSDERPRTHAEEKHVRDGHRRRVYRVLSLINQGLKIGKVRKA